MRGHGMSARRLRRLRTRHEGDSPGHGDLSIVVPGASCAVRCSARAAKHRKRPVEAAGAVDAKNAPTAPWKTA